MPKALSFDRTITISVIITLFVQTAGALLWAGAAEARIKSLEAKALTHAEIAERLIRIEEQMIATQTSLSRIETRLDP